MREGDSRAERFRYQEVVLVVSCALLMPLIWIGGDLVRYQYTFVTIPVVAFSVFGAYTEISSKGEPLFSKTTLVVPALVPLFLFWTYMNMFLDGQTFSQRIAGAVVCICCYAMLGFYGVRNRKNNVKVAIFVLLFSVTSCVMWDKLCQIRHFYDYQKSFNASVYKLSHEQNNLFEPVGSGNDASRRT